MTSPTPPIVECEKMHVTLPVSDLERAIEFYLSKPGFRWGFSSTKWSVVAGTD
jgi:extradiol dioxygenase family protein